MKPADIKIGDEFYCGSRKWRCTDIGTRTIIAICLDGHITESWLDGPPYALTEMVFDENDFDGITLHQ